MCRFNAIKRRQRCNQNISSRARLKGKWLTKNFKKQIIVMLHNIFIKWKYMCNVVRIVKQAPRSWSEEAMLEFRWGQRKEKSPGKGKPWPGMRTFGGKTHLTHSFHWLETRFFLWLVSCTTLFWMRNSQTRPSNHQWEETRSMKRKPRQVGTTPTGVGPLSHLQGLWAAA